MTLRLEQHRMKAAYDAAADEQVKAKADVKDAYKSLVAGLGAEVQRSGLLMALAFVHRGNQEVARIVDRTIRTHLLAQRFLLPEMTIDGAKKSTKSLDFFTIARHLDTADYMTVTREVIALAHWMKRAPLDRSQHA